MKKIIAAIYLSVLSFSSMAAPASALNSEAKKNYQATRQYYAQLVGATPTRLAELEMLMGMMPKGGDIHHHYSGSIYAETYFDWVEREGFCVYRESDSANKQEKFRIDATPPAKQTAAPELNKNCIKADAVRKDNNFYRELISAWSIMDFDNHVHQQPAPDQQFFNTFGYFSSISKFSTNLGLKILKQQAKAENQQYLETMLKSAPVTDHPEWSGKIDALTSASTSEEMRSAFAKLADFLAQDETAQKKIADYVKEIANDVAGVDDADFTLRIQSYVSRNSAPSKVFSGLYAAFAASQNNPVIVGVNIVGPENGIVALRDYTLHMQMFAFLKQRFPQVHLSLHAGELALGLVPPEYLQSHMREAINIAHAERLGHGVDIMHEAHPDQILHALKQQNVAVEINLSSNAFILGLQKQEHPITLYLQHQVPFVISSDDAGVSRSKLSHEYQLFTSRYKPSYETLKKTVYNSIRYSFLNAADKAKQLRQLDQSFSKFEATAAQLARSAKSSF